MRFPKYFSAILFETPCHIAVLLLLSIASLLHAQEVPDLTSYSMGLGSRHVGEILHELPDATILYDISVRDMVRVDHAEIKNTTRNIDEMKARYFVPFATYAAWKLTKLMKTGIVQGNIAAASEQGIFINLGSAAGIKVDMNVKLLGEGTSITDPETDKILAVIRPTVARLTVTQVVNDKLSKVELADPDQELDFQRGMMIEIERPSKTVMFVPPKWKSANANLKVGDEALYVTEHVLTELLRYGVNIISREQVTRVTESLAEEAGKQASDISPLEVAEALNAGVMITGELLAQANFGNVFLHATDVQSTQVLGILRGRIQRDKIKDAALEARKLQLRIEREIAKLPPLAIEMIRRTKILTQLIEAGCQVVIQVPNGARVTYKGKELPAPEVGFPPVFIFDWVHFYDGNAHLSALLAGLKLRRFSYHLTDSKPEYFSVLNAQVVLRDFDTLSGARLIIDAPITDKDITLNQRHLLNIEFKGECGLTSHWLLNQHLPTLRYWKLGKSVLISEIRQVHLLKPTLKGIGVDITHLSDRWTNSIPDLGLINFHFAEKPAANVKEQWFAVIKEFRQSSLFQRIRILGFFSLGDDQRFCDQTMRNLLLSPQKASSNITRLDLQLPLPNVTINEIRQKYPLAEVTILSE